MAGRQTVFAISMIGLSLSGCQQDIVQRRVNSLTSTVTNLYYEEVLNNLAMVAKTPDIVPYFGIPTQGTHTNARTVSAGYTPMWDFVTMSMKPFTGGYLFDHQASPLMGQIQNQQAFQLQPVSNPDKLFLMQTAYKLATGNTVDATLKRDLDAYFANDRLKKSKQHLYFDYFSYVPPSGWFQVTKDRRVAKKCGRYIGQYEDTYVYVTADHIKDLSNFTLAMLDIATVDTNQQDGLKARINIFPYPSPPVAATPSL